MRTLSLVLATVLIASPVLAEPLHTPRPPSSSDFGTGVGKQAPVKRGVTFPGDLSPRDGAQTLINRTIVANGIGSITGPVLNAALSSILPIFDAFVTFNPTTGVPTLNIPAGSITATMLAPGVIPPSPSIPTNLTGIAKLNGSSTITAASPGTDYVVPNGSAAALTAGAPARSFAQILADTIDVRNYGVVCDNPPANNGTDNGPKLTSLATQYTTLLMPASGCAGTYLVNTSVSVPAGTHIIGSGMSAPTFNASASTSQTPLPGSIQTTAAVDTFLATGDHVTFRDLVVLHTGSAGKVFNLAGTSYAKVLDTTTTATNASNTDATIYGYGVQHIIDHVFINQYRPNAYGIDIDSKTNASPYGTASVNWMLSNDVIFGAVKIAPTGPGIRIYSTSGVNNQAPQGIYLTNVTVQTEGKVNLLLGQVLNLFILSSTFDNGEGITFAPTSGGQGILAVDIGSSYIATPLDGTNGVALNQTSNSVIIGHVNVHHSIIANAGYGVGFTGGNVDDLVLDTIKFVGIGSIAVNMQNVQRGKVVHSTCSTCTKGNLTLADGSSGGPYTINDNGWDSAGPAPTITKTTPSKFHFGEDNTGWLLANRAQSAAVSFTTTGCAGTTVAHGLSGTPNDAKTQLSTVYSGNVSNVTVAQGGVSSSSSTPVQVCATVTGSGGGTVTVNEYASQ